MVVQPKSCQKCGGALAPDGDEWRCWQCGRHYYPVLPPESSQEIASEIGSPNPQQHLEHRGPMQMHGLYDHRARPNINSIILAKGRSDERWWIKNAHIIRYLDEGRSVKEISVLVGRGERQIRVIRERLNDLRAVSDPGLPAA